MENSILNDRMLNAKDLSVCLRISLSQAYNLLGSDDFPTSHVGGRKVVRESLLEEWIEKNTNHVNYH